MDQVIELLDGEVAVEHVEHGALDQAIDDAIFFRVPDRLQLDCTDDRVALGGAEADAQVFVIDGDDGAFNQGRCVTDFCNEIQIRHGGVEMVRRTHAGAKRLDPVREAGVAPKELRSGVDDVEGGLGPSQRAVQFGEPVLVHAGDIAGERAFEIRSGLRKMEGALEVTVAGDGPLLVLEEQLFHAREVHARLHLIGLLRPVRHVHVAGRDRGCAVSVHVDAIEVNARPVDGELRLHARRHRNELLNAHLAATELRGATVAGRVANLDVEVRADDAPRRLVILERELAAMRAQAPQRHREGPRLFRPSIVVNEARKVVALFPSLDQHLPVGHLDRRNREIRFPRGRGRPVEADIDPVRCKERPIVVVHAVDADVFDTDLAAEEVDAERADVQRALDVLRAFTLGGFPHRGTEIDRERGDDRDRQHDHRRGKAETGVAKNPAFAESGEELH